MKIHFFFWKLPFFILLFFVISFVFYFHQQLSLRFRCNNGCRCCCRLFFIIIITPSYSLVCFLQ